MTEVEDPGASSEAAGDGGPTLVVASVDKMQNYLRRVVPVLIEEDEAGSPEMQVEGGDPLAVALNDKKSVETVRKFMSEPQVRALLVAR